MRVRFPLDPPIIHSKDKGDISEYKVITKLLEKDWIVSKTIGDNAHYDLIVNRGNNLERVQVKTAHIKGNIIKAGLKSNGYKLKDGKAILFSEHYSPAELELFALYCPDNDKVYIIPNMQLMHDISLRIEHSSAGNGKPIRYAKDYEI